MKSKMIAYIWSWIALVATCIAPLVPHHHHGDAVCVGALSCEHHDSDHTADATDCSHSPSECDGNAHCVSKALYLSSADQHESIDLALVPLCSEEIVAWLLPPPLLHSLFTESYGEHPTPVLQPGYVMARGLRAPPAVVA